MSRSEYWTLNIVGGLCAAVILLNFTLVQLNTRLNRDLATMQDQFNRTQKIKGYLDAMVEAASKSPDPVVRGLLIKHKFFLPPETGKK